MLTKSKILAPNLKSLENYDWHQDLNFFYQNRDFPQNLPQLSFPENFD